MIIYFMLIFISTAKATDTKYIDLLPEKEKDIFLERVARRILEEVDSKPVQQKSLDVTKDELDVHSEFVKKILQEEETNLRKHYLDNKEDLSVKPLDENKNIDLTVRSRNRRNSNVSFEANTELENNGVHSDIKTELIKDPSGKSDEKDIQIKNFKVKTKNNDPKVESEANNVDVQTISTNRVSVETQTPITEHYTEDRVEQVTNTFNSRDAAESKINATHTDKTNQSLSINTELTSNTEKDASYVSRKINDENKPMKDIRTEKHNNETEITTEQVKEALRNITFLDIPVQVLREDTIQNVEETSSKASTAPTTEVVTTTTQKEEDKIETAPVKSELKSKENLKRDINSVTNQIENHKEINGNATEASSNIIHIFKHSKTVYNNTNNNLFIDVQTSSKPSIDVHPKTEKRDSNENVEIVSARTESTDTMSKINLDITEDNMFKVNAKRTLKSDQTFFERDDSSKPYINHLKMLNQSKTKHVESDFEVTTQKVEVLTPLIPLTSTFDTKNDVKQTKKVDNNIIQVLRDVVERNKVKSNGRLDGFKTSSPTKVHKVYEIPNEKTLAIDNITNEEQPYYYPIYNYSPNNAYYNAHNNLGPKQDDFGIQRDKDNDLRLNNFQTSFSDDNENIRKLKFDYSDDSKAEDKKDKYNLKLPIVFEYPINMINYYNDRDISRSNSKKNIEEINHKSSLQDIRLMMYANKLFGDKPKNMTYTSIEDSTIKVTEKPSLRLNVDAISNRVNGVNERQKQIADDSNFSIDYYFSRMNGNSKPNKNKQSNHNIPILNDIQELIDKNNYKIYLIDPLYLESRTKKRISRKEEKPNYEEIINILDMFNDVDLLPTLNKLLKVNATRSGVKERDIDIYVDVLTDMIETGNEALEQYDWLGTTVNIQAAALKIFELIQLVHHKKYINPSDLELLKYIIYLFKEASIIKEYDEELRMKLPRGKNMKRKLIKTKGLIDRVWLFRQLVETKNNKYKLMKKDNMEVLSQFLDELQNSLYELHTSIKEIASITRYNRQNWFKNLKELYLNRTRNRTLEVLLHLTANRVIDIVEKSANGLENNYLKYVKRNGKEVERTVNELVFLNKILEGIKNDE